MKHQSAFLSLAAALSLATNIEAFVPRRSISSSKPAVFSTFTQLFNTNNDDDLRKAEDAAAQDAHDCSDPGMEAAAEERAVMMAEEIMHLKVKKEIHLDATAAEESVSFDRQHTATDKEIKKAEKAAAVDGHDCSDAGMETAAEERAVMMAYEMAEKMKKEQKKD